MLAIAFLVLVNVTGVWSAEQTYPLSGGSARDGQWIQNASGTFDYRWATPLAGRPEPLADVIHLLLYVQPASDGKASAFIRNPEFNAGAFIGTRTLTLDGSTVRLLAPGRPDVVGRYEASVDRLVFHFTQLPGEFEFHRMAQSDPLPYVYHPPQQSADGWQVGSLQTAGIDARGIAKVIDTEVLPAPTSLRAPFIQSLVIARYGRLVLDEYFNGFDADRPHDVRSAGKSVTTLLVGRAIEDGADLTPHSRVYTLLARYAPFANFDDRKARMTLADLMSMQSGYACDDNDDNSPGNEDVMQSQTKQLDWYKYALDMPMQSAPGTKAVYCTAGINLLGAIVAESAKQWLPSYFATRFAQPMQFGRYALWLMPAPVNDAYMGGGDRFRPRDFLKFGQLLLNNGSWNGKHVIDTAWLQAVATKRSTIADEMGNYGWGWHLYTYDVGGKKIQAISAGGNGGQLLFVFPQLDMTVMITAANYGQYPVWSGYIEKLVPELLACVKST